jgi:hypothetical protein
MGEYQYYEFQAIDRPLTQRELDELRTHSTRATITPTRFVNFYNWSSFKGDPAVWMEKYFDALLHVASWGTHCLMFRLPRHLLDLETARRYCCGQAALARAWGDFVILEVYSEDEETDDWDDDGSGWLSSLISLRADLRRGDYRALYLAWLLCAQSGELAGEALEPPVPAGLGTLTAPLRALSDFLRLDEDLLEIAAAGSSGVEVAPRRDLEQWIAALPAAKKAALLVRLMAGEEPQLQEELLGPPAARPRTVAELLAAAAHQAEKRRRAKVDDEARERNRREREEVATRERYLSDLAEREPEIWNQVDALIATKRPADYDHAVMLLGDLRDLGIRKGREAEVQARIAEIREAHARKPRFIDRLRKTGLVQAAR